MGARNVGRTGKVTINGQTFDAELIEVAENDTPNKVGNVPPFTAEYKFVLCAVPLNLNPRKQYPPPTSFN